MRELLEGKLQRFEELERQMSDPEVLAVGSRIAAVAREHGSLSKLAIKYRRFKNLVNEIAELLKMATSPDPEERAMAEAELPGARERREVYWSEILDMTVGGEEANRILASKGAQGFNSVFNGRDFTGWAGPVDNYVVTNGTVLCKPGKGGTIFTKDEFSDFVARVEFKVPSGGNNGLALRYPGTGDTAYGGMCELQVLDDNYDKVKGKIDPRQVHGSAYGMVGAQRGYQHPIGEWNFQEVTVKGSKIKVELNGTVILDADLSKVTEYMAGSAHPGKDRKSGHFGFAGHNDPVAFRNVQIKKLAE